MSQAYIMSMDLNQILAHMHKGLECAICLELLNNPVSTKCDHQFCRFCITKFLQNKRSVPCPLCKVPVTKRGLQERRELYNIVNNVKKLISAYEADTGEKYSPSKRPQTLASRTSKRKSCSRKEQVSPKHAKSSPESQNRLEKSTGELEDENAGIFYTSGTSSKAAATARIQDARDSSSIDSISSADEKTKTRHRKPSQSEIGDHSEIHPIETEKNLEKSNEWLSETARSTRSKSRTQVTGHQPSPNRASPDQVRVSSVNEIKNKLLDKHPAKTKSRKETEDCMTEADRSIQCVEEEHEARRVGKDKKVPGGRNIDVDKENSSCSDELLRYLEEGSCGAAWNVTHETPKTQPDLTEQIKKSSHHAKTVQPNDTTHKLQNQQAVATKGTSKQANDFNSKKVSLRSSRSRVSLSPVKTNVLPTDAEMTQHDSSVKDSHSNSSVQANVKDNEEQANVIPNDSKLFGKQQESSPCNARPDMASPVSDVSSISSTQQLMKPKPVVSRTYTKDMQNLFRAEGRVRNWVGTLPEPHAKDEGSEMKQLRGLTTKEKINAKKRPPKKVKASPQTIQNNGSSADINSHQDDGKNTGAIRDEAALLHCSTEFQFELPLTPKPIRKCIFKSRHQTNSKESHTKAEITQEPLTPITSEDPYEFKGGQTPVKAKKIPASGRGKAKKSESKKSAKSASADVFKVPLELTHKQKGHTVTRHKDAASETAIEQAPTEQGQAPTNQDESIHNLETQESTKLHQNIKKLKTVHFAESHIIGEDTVPHKSKAKQKDSDKILNDSGVQSDVNKIHDNPHTDQHVTGADDISNMSSETATHSFMDNTVECPPELAESQAVKEIDLESTRAENDENTTQVTRSGKSKRGRKGKHEKPMEETSGDGQKEQSDVEKIHSSAKKRKFARRNNRKAKAMDSETSSQRSGREMAKLIHKISEAEDYELMFSTQEARQNMLEEQLKQQNYNEAFGFDTDESDILANISEAEKQPNQDSKVEEAKQQETPLHFIEDEPFTDLQMVSEENEGDKIKDSVLEESSSSVIGTTPGAKNVICNDKTSGTYKPAEGKGETSENNDLNKKELITGKLGKSSESSDCHNKKFKSGHCINSTEKNMSQGVKRNLSTNYQLFTPMRSRACRFPRPNFNEMIQVSPGPGGLDTCSRSGQEAAIIEESSLICSSLLGEMSSDTEKKSRGEKQSAVDYQEASQKIVDEETNASNKFLQNLRFNESSNNAVQNSLLSLKSRDTTPQAAAASEANKADVQVTDGAFSETVLAADTCVELDCRSEKENMLKVGDTVVQETMDIDTNCHQHAEEFSPTESSVHFTETNVRAPLEESETNHAKLKKQSCEVVAETQLRSTLSTQSPNLLTVHSTHDEHNSKETQVSRQGNYNKTDTTTIPDSCILINSEVSQRNEDGSLMARADVGPLESGQSIESQSVLQFMKLKNSNSEQDVVISEKVHHDRDMAATSLNTNSFSSCIVPPSNNQTEDPKCKSHIIKQVTHQSTSKRKFGEVSSRSASLQVKTTPDSKSSSSNHISSAPSKFHLSDSEEEDSVLIVRRSKRKCLSLDGSPLKPVVFGHSRVNIQKDSQQLLKNVANDAEMLGETEAMAVLDTWTEQEAEHGDEQMVEADGKGSDSNSGEQKELQIELPPEEMTPASPEAPYPLVEVTPVGKLKYINSSGKYIVDMNDRGFSSQTSSSSQKCLFPEATEKRLTRSALKAQKDERFTIQGQESSRCGKDNRCSMSEFDRDGVQHANVRSKQGMTGSPNNSVNTGGLTEACLTRPVDVTPSGNMDSSYNSSSSERKRHTRRGLASKRMNLNLESLPKHPRGSLSPSSKAAIKKSVQKPETSTPCHAADKQIPEEIIDVDNDIDDVGARMNNNITGCDDTEKETNSTDDFNNPQDEGVEDTRIHDAVSDSAKSLRKNAGKDFKGDGDEELLQEKELVDPKCKEMDTDAKSESDKGKQPPSTHNVQCSTKSRDDGHSNKENENEVLSFDLGVNLSDDSADEADNVLTEEAEANKKCGDDLVKTDGNKHMSHDVELENEEQEDDMKSSSSLPLTSSPLEGTKDVSEEEFDQSLIAAVDETISDSQDSVCVGARRKIKRQQIASDSEDSNQGDGQVQSPTNCTSSSAFSSQSETLTTQQQEALEGDLARLHKEIAKYEAELGKEKSNSATAEEAKGESSNEISDDGDQKASNNVINESPAEVTAAVVVSDSEDSNDLFVSPVSPSPHGPANTKTSIRKPVSLEPKQADQMLKQFQSPGGTVRTKKALEFTMTNSLIQSGLPKDVANADKSTVSGRSSKQSGHSSQDDIVHIGKDSGSVHSLRPASPIILSQRSKYSQDTVNVDETKSDAKLSLRGNVPAKELCFVGSGLGREENLKVLRLAEQHSAKFTPKFSKDVSHVIMKPAAGYQRVCDRTLKFFQGVAHKCWVVAYSWVADSLRAGRLLPEEDYEIVGDTSGGECTNGVKLSRLSDGHLFSDFCFACVGDSQEMPKESLCDLLTTCGAVTVDDPIALLSKVATYKIIVRCSDIDNTPTSAEMDMFNGLYKHMGLLTVMREWVLDSLGAYTHLPMADYVLNTCETKVPF